MRRLQQDRPHTCNLLTLAVLTALASAGPAASQVASTFDADLDGWKINGDNSAVWLGTAGNPPGCLDVNDLATGSMNWAIAPVKFLGDWSGFTAEDTLSFDVYEVNTSGGAWLTVQQVRIAGPYGAAWANAAAVPTPPATGVWLTGRIPFDAAYWTVESGLWEALLTNITSLRIFAEWVNGDEVTRLDNVRLSATPGSVTTECVESTFTEAGIGDWSFEGAGTASNPGSGGNGGGFLQVADRTGANSYGFAPPAFLGDWSSLDGSGSLTLDIRVLSAAGTNLGSPDFIRLAGPGGTAHVALSAGDLTIPPRVWKRFTFPLQASGWVVDAGSWAALLAQVTECRLDLEYYDGTETVGLDNFGRRAAGCPPIDEPVSVAGTGVASCGYASLVGISTVALNPVDGELYGLLRATSGGFFRVTGGEAGVFQATYSNPAHLIFAPNGDAFISEDYDGNIYRKAWGGASSLWVSGFHSGDDDPYGLAIAPPGFDGPNVSPGDILVADRGNSGPDEIWSFSPTVAETEALLMPDPGEVDFFDLAAAGAETVFVADALDDAHLWVLNDQGVRTGLTITPPLDGICSVVYDPPTGLLYVASCGDKRVHRVDPATGLATTVASGFTTFDPCCLEIDAANRRLYVADKGMNRVYAFCLASATGVDGPPPEAAAFQLGAHPNPFNPTASVTFTLPRAADARLTVHDAAGRLVRVLHDGRLREGPHRLAWNGRDDGGRGVAAGLYFLRLAAEGRVEVHKLALVR